MEIDSKIVERVKSIRLMDAPRILISVRNMEESMAVQAIVSEAGFLWNSAIAKGDFKFRIIKYSPHCIFLRITQGAQNTIFWSDKGELSKSLQRTIFTFLEFINCFCKKQNGTLKLLQDKVGWVLTKTGERKGGDMDE